MEKTQLCGKGLEANKGVPEMMMEKTGGADRDMTVLSECL